jgi:hypothetical protein
MAEDTRHAIEEEKKETDEEARDEILLLRYYPYFHPNPRPKQALKGKRKESREEKKH